MPDQFYEHFETEDAREEYHEYLDAQDDYDREDAYRHRPYDVRCMKCDTTAYGSEANLEAIGWKLGKHTFCPQCSGN